MRIHSTRPLSLLLLLLMVLGGGVWLAGRRGVSMLPAASPTGGEDLERANALRVARLEARERKIDQTVWTKEILAESCGAVFEALWDRLNATTNKWPVLAAFPVTEVVLPRWQAPQSLAAGISFYLPAGLASPLNQAAWQRHINGFRRAGWQLEQVEFRHTRFDTDAAGRPAQSRFSFSAHLRRPARPRDVGGGDSEGGAERALLEGPLVVDWAADSAGGGAVRVKRIDAGQLSLKTRRDEPPFQLILNDPVMPAGGTGRIDPLILYDLDGDGLSEIVLAAKNRVYRRCAPDRYRAEPLCRYPPGLVMSAVIADFDGDGNADFLCAEAKGLVLFKGSAHGTFDEPGRLVWVANPPLVNAMVLTCGAIDGDGDLDVFLAQYKTPTLGQILRPHYYDANDGYPAYLLRNDGHGNFTDATEAAGLATRRWRRTYSASFADLGDRGCLDLVVVSDFAGVDFYRNNGHGRFTEMTRQWTSESHGFGMAHALADFNADGGLDLLMIGMPSPTADRLDHLGLWRPDAAEDRTMRGRMTFGNRLLLARAGGGFEQTSMSTTIARSGWSWGCAAFDFDNDGFPDVYIANGMQSQQRVRDYEGEFWLHDLYVGDEVDDVTATRYFLNKFARTRRQGWSYGGYEKNRLYLNRGGTSFVEAGYLLGVALGEDCRNVVADDLDGDGRVDLLCTTFEVWPTARQTLRVYRNTLARGGHWIGFRFREARSEPSPVGARVTVYYNGHCITQEIITGDSYRSQHANSLHFGLGEAERVERVEVRWPSGARLTLRGPSVNRYHWIHAPTSSR